MYIRLSFVLIYYTHRDRDGMRNRKDKESSAGVSEGKEQRKKHHINTHLDTYPSAHAFRPRIMETNHSPHEVAENSLFDAQCDRTVHSNNNLVLPTE